MNIDIRQHIINNFKGDSKENINKSIESSINDADEVVLPGMGVLLEIIWKNIDSTTKDKLLNVLEQNINR